MKRRIKPCWTCSDYVRHEHRWKFAAWICGRIQSASLAIRRLLCVHVEYSVDTTDSAGDWRLWSDGFPTRESAEEHMRECVRLGKGWNGIGTPKWRVARRIVFTKYYDAK